MYVKLDGLFRPDRKNIQIMIKRVTGVYFSPVGGTKKIAERLTAEIAACLNASCPDEITTSCVDLLVPGPVTGIFDEETVAVIGMPVYVGKVPLPAVQRLKNLAVSGCNAVIAVSYGGRSYGNALYELQHFAEEQGFKVIGAGAFSVRYGKRHGVRESAMDDSCIREFSKAASAKIARLAGCEIEGLRIKPAPLHVVGKLPIHRISRISPAAAAVAQGMLEKICFRRRNSEWYL